VSSIPWVAALPWKISIAKMGMRLVKGTARTIGARPSTIRDRMSLLDTM
jgi:hypothetical protein